MFIPWWQECQPHQSTREATEDLALWPQWLNLWESYSWPEEVLYQVLSWPCPPLIWDGDDVFHWSPSSPHPPPPESQTQPPLGLQIHPRAGDVSTHGSRAPNTSSPHLFCLCFICNAFKMQQNQLAMLLRWLLKYLRDIVGSVSDNCNKANKATFWLLSAKMLCLPYTIVY